MDVTKEAVAHPSTARTAMPANALEDGHPVAEGSVTALATGFRRNAYPSPAARG